VSIQACTLSSISIYGKFLQKDQNFRQTSAFSENLKETTR
jgi:hypothetical protein